MFRQVGYSIYKHAHDVRPRAHLKRSPCCGLVPIPGSDGSSVNFRANGAIEVPLESSAASSTCARAHPSALLAVLSTFGKTLSFIHVVRYLGTFSISETGQHQTTDTSCRDKQVSLTRLSFTLVVLLVSATAPAFCIATRQ